MQDSRAKVVVSLAPSGQLQMELPAVGGLRTVVLKDKFALDLLKRTLIDLQLGAEKIGTGGAPTRQQIRHEENHQIFPDSRCPFCQARLIDKYLKDGGKISGGDLEKLELSFDD